MLNYNHFIEQSINIENNIDDLQPLAGRQVFVFPFQIISGTTILTENGEKTTDYDPEDFTSYFNVLDGKSSAIAIWDDSTFATNSEDAGAEWYYGNYKVGNWYKGYVDDDSAGMTIGNINGLDGYTAMKPVKNFMISFGRDADEVITEDEEGNKKTQIDYWDVPTKDLLKLYILPELFGKQWLKIDNVTKLYSTGGELVRVNVSFSSVSDSLSSTAGTRVSMIQESASGEGYAWPNIVTIPTEEIIHPDGSKEVIEGYKKIELDTWRLTPTPITSQQVKYDGIAAIHTLAAMGRIVRRSELEIKLENENTTFKKRIYPSRLLLPSRTVASYNEKLSFVSKPIDNFYIAARAEPTFKTYFADWREQIKVLYDPTAIANYEGVLQCGGPQNQWKDEIFGTNQLIGNKYGHTLKDNSKVRVCKENIFYPTQATPACATSINFLANQAYSYAEILAHNFFISSPMITLPQGANSTTTWGISSLPVVGGFLNTFLLGSNVGFQTNTTKIPTPQIPLLIPAEVFDIQLAMSGGTQFQTNLPFDMFRFGKADQLGAIVGFGNFNTTVRTMLTHKYVSKLDVSAPANDTLFLGQTKKLDGEPFAREIEWNQDCSPIEFDDPRAQDELDKIDRVVGYIIDSHTNKAVFSGNYTLTFLSLDNLEGLPQPVNDFKLITKSSMTNSIREWTNIYHTSFWRKNFNVDFEKNWPEALLLPIKNQDVESDVKISGSNLETIERSSFLVDLETPGRVISESAKVREVRDIFNSYNIGFDAADITQQLYVSDTVYKNITILPSQNLIHHRNFISPLMDPEARIDKFIFSPIKLPVHVKATDISDEPKVDFLNSFNKTVIEEQQIHTIEDLISQFRTFEFTISVKDSGFLVGQIPHISENNRDYTIISLTAVEMLKMYNEGVFYTPNKFISFASGYPYSILKHYRPDYTGAIKAGCGISFAIYGLKMDKDFKITALISPKAIYSFGFFKSDFGRTQLKGIDISNIVCRK